MQIRDIRKNKKLCTFSYYEAIDRLVITNITEIKESDNSEILLDSEHLSKETVKKMLSDLIDQATLID